MVPHLPRLNGALARGHPASRARSVGDVPQEVAEIDHPGGRDGDIGGARVLKERHRGQQADRDAGADRRVQGGAHLGQRLESGSWLSRAMPKASRIVEVMIERQHTKIAAATTSR